MAKGPCLCGDPHCPSCGSPEAAEVEAAEEACLESFAEAGFYAADYPIATAAGIEAVKEHHKKVLPGKIPTDEIAPY